MDKIQKLYSDIMKGNKAGILDFKGSELEQVEKEVMRLCELYGITKEEQKIIEDSLKS